MLRTPFCTLFGIEHPIVQAAIYPAISPELVAAVCNAGGLGSLGAVFTSPDRLASQVVRVRQLTDRPFVVNHVLPQLDQDTFSRTLDLRPAAISLALGEPTAEVVDRAHAAGIRVIHQVHTVGQAERAATVGVDAIIAQGSEAGGMGLAHGPTTFVLVPQVVDAVSPIPVLAAGGIGDGRGLAAALVLGAQGVNVGTRFLASNEASAPAAWKALVIDTESEEVIRFASWSSILPLTSPPAYPVVPNVIPTPFTERWRDRPDEAKAQAESLRGEIMTALREGRNNEVAPFAGQTAGLIHEVRPAADIVQDMVAEAEVAFAR
jgi:nitronate monooxygenase/enoyl-[acyl-carrier protein] reductase II